ncbi:hypothetical protein GCM10017620_01530 [Brevundimonas intermedia]|uniref:Uncharacterized protein n=1 Tax=Brevundimonas intermedia TaxID=74315 RepID=A0ABQ5T507_9CAUL|nr:hypothetical protein GCM10017620_01530 [Brevundimonas intermedia]
MAEQQLATGGIELCLGRDEQTPVRCGKLRLHLNLARSDCEVLLLPVRSPPRQDGTGRTGPSQDLVPQKQEFADQAYDLLRCEETFPPPPQHVVPVGKSLKDEPKTGPVRPAGMIRSRIKQMAAERSEDVELIPVFEGENEPRTISRSTLEGDVDAVEPRRLRQLTAAVIGRKREDVLPRVISAPEEIQRMGL